MIFNKEILFCVLILFFTQIFIWFQLNAQVKWDWFKDNYLLMALMGTPISYALMYSTKYGYEGTADSIGLVNDNLFILDWKTSKSLYIENLLQVSAYANAYTELTGNQISNAGVLRLDKNKSGYEFKIIDDLNKHFITFRAVLWLWRFLNDPDSSYSK